MKFEQQKDLVAISIVTALFILFVVFTPSTALRVILGLPFILFFPGYTLIAALFPRKGDLDGVERIALSFGVSVAVLILVGLVLNFVWRLDVYPALLVFSIFILGTSGVAWHRRRLAGTKKFTVSLSIRLPSWRGWDLRDKVLSIVLAAMILGAMAVLGYIIAIPKAEETFTEFYILGAGEETGIYPEELRVGEEGRVIIGIVNREHKHVSYQIKVEAESKIKVRVDGKEVDGGIPVVLRHEEKWEGEVVLIPKESGENQKVEFWLYKEGESKPYLEDPLHLWLDVRQ